MKAKLVLLTICAFSLFRISEVAYDINNSIKQHTTFIGYHTLELKELNLHFSEMLDEYYEQQEYVEEYK